MVVLTCNFSYWEAEVGGLQSKASVDKNVLSKFHQKNLKKKGLGVWLKRRPYIQTPAILKKKKKKS
jgi:hypothetical protein